MSSLRISVGKLVSRSGFMLDKHTRVVVRRDKGGIVLELVQTKSAQEQCVVNEYFAIGIVLTVKATGRKRHTLEFYKGELYISDPFLEVIKQRGKETCNAYYRRKVVKTEPLHKKMQGKNNNYRRLDHKRTHSWNVGRIMI